MYPLKFCSHRWTENKIVEERVIDVWENVVETVKYWIRLQKSKQPRDSKKSYQRLKSAITDPLIPVKLKLFAKAADELNKFLVLYQTDNPMVPFIAQSLEEIIRQFASTFILSEKLKAATSLVSLSKIDFKDGTCHKRAADVSLSIPIKVQLSDLKKRGKISDTQILKFKSDVVSFLSSLCAHLVEKSPIKYPLTRAARCFIPYLLVEVKKTSENRFTNLLENLLKSEQTSGKIVEDAKREFTKFL